MSSATMKFFVHPMTIRYTDYGSHLQTVTGIAWSSDGENTYGFEQGKTIADIRAKVAAIGAPVEIVEGTPVGRTHDMNPRGLI